ncbi:MAG TPA: DUF4783 domain-containing protein [Paludibacteraceae bacterium]|nr:DUF4783 domain-containing protein [Paludibacteraceae bacterium]HPT42681.1 DUF4783 domain-containing protein [Paludibacteraceae bacterium]
MKTYKFIALIAFFSLITSQNITAQNVDVPNEITVALNSGDAGKLSAWLNNNVELVIGDKNDVYSKQQAIGIISDFFKNNSVLGFQVLHKGNREAASFVIGTLKTSSRNYRVYVLTRRTGKQSLIQQLRIETNNE